MDALIIEWSALEHERYYGFGMGALIPVRADALDTPRGSESPNATAVTTIATPTPTIPVNVNTFETSRGSEGAKATIVTRIATPNPHDPRDC